ncbi:MAG: DUF11 domain-containing protein [Erythrobacter sp.]
MFTKYLKLWLLVAASLGLGLTSQTVNAQTTLTADWTNLGNGSLQEVNDGTVLTVGPNAVTIDTAVVTDGDGNDGNFTNFYSTGNLSYFAGQVSSFTGNLLYSNDHSVFDAGDYFETTYTFNDAVDQLDFTVGNVDRFFGTDGGGNPANFHDAVIIEYDTGSGAWQNLRNLAGAVTLGSAVGTTTVGGQQGWHGIAYSGGITSTTGDIRVDFGTTTVERVRIRYRFGQQQPATDPSGNFQYLAVSDFTWQQNVDVADLSLTKVVNNPTPAQGSSVTYTLTLTNNGPLASNNVEVLDLLPTGVDFTSSGGFGTYNDATGIWTIPSIASGQSRVLTITGDVIAPAGVTITNSAEVFSTATFDADSTPNNGSTTEDDDASAPFTVQGVRTAGVAPILTCPAGTNVFDWDATTWAAGSTNNTYAIASFGDVNFSIVNQGTWVNDPAFGGLSPAISQENSGGLAVAEDTLHQYIDFNDRFEVATTTITLPNGVAGTQFTVFDIDFAANDFADKLTVTGSYNGATVIPTLTNGVANYVVGNTAIGDSTSANNSGNGNVEVTFDQPIDTIIISYGNGSAAPVNPDGQAIAIHDFEICAPATELSVAKTSTVFSDPVNNTTNPKAIPGALIEYNIGVSNIGISDADEDSVFVVDTVPSDTKLCVTDIGGSGPVNFIDGSTSSDLTYSFIALGNLGDDLAFSDDGGATWDYEPTADPDGCDAAITDFRVNPQGAFAGDGSFSLRARFLVE